MERRKVLSKLIPRSERKFRADSLTITPELRTFPGAPTGQEGSERRVLQAPGERFVFGGGFEGEKCLTVHVFFNTACLMGANLDIPELAKLENVFASEKLSIHTVYDMFIRTVSPFSEFPALKNCEFRFERMPKMICQL